MKFLVFALCLVTVSLAYTTTNINNNNKEDVQVILIQILHYWCLHLFTQLSSPSILDLVSPPSELDTGTRPTILAMATASMPTRDIMADTMVDTTMLATTTEVTATFLRPLSMVVDITLTTGTTNKNEKSFRC